MELSSHCPWPLRLEKWLLCFLLQPLQEQRWAFIVKEVRKQGLKNLSFVCKSHEKDN